MMINKPTHWRPFNFEEAKRGIPYGTLSGRSIRLISWDKKTPTGTEMVLLLDRENKGTEIIVTGDRTTGMLNGIPEYCNDRLVMLPIFYLEGKPVFNGDTLIKTSNSVSPTCYEVKANAGMVGCDMKYLCWPTVKKEVWQPRMKSVSKPGYEYILYERFESKEACDRHYDRIMQGHQNAGMIGTLDRYFRAELVCSYEE